MHEIYSIITLARPVVEAIERRDRDLGAKVRRALNSIALNTADGLGCRAGHSRNRFALGSLFEVSASIGVARAWQYVGEDDCAELLKRIHVLGTALRQDAAIAPVATTSQGHPRPRQLQKLCRFTRRWAASKLLPRGPAAPALRAEMRAL